MHTSDVYPNFTLRIFLSVDLVGSSAFKQRAGTHWQSQTTGASTSRSDIPEDAPKESSSDEWLESPQEPEWFLLFGRFFEEFESDFLAAWHDVNNLMPDSKEKDELFDGDPPRFWKAVGDEIIFVKEVTRFSQCALAVFAFRVAMKRFRQKLQDFTPTIEIKAAAWLAQFPVINREIVVGDDIDPLTKSIPRDDVVARTLLRSYFYKKKKGRKSKQRPDQFLDFIGPQMDLGFRLMEHASPRHFALSLDLVYILCRAISHPGGSLRPQLMRLFDQGQKPDPKKEEPDYTLHAPNELKFGFLGLKPLKGILSGVPYPIFWIPGRENSLFAHEEDFLGVVRKARVADIQEYCREYLVSSGRQSGSWLCLPYLALAAYEYVRATERNQANQEKHFDEGIPPPHEHEERLRLVRRAFQERMAEFHVHSEAI